MKDVKRWGARCAALGLLSVALALPACGEVASDGDEALRRALATSAGRMRPGEVFSPEKIPLAAARPHRLVVEAELSLSLDDAERVLKLRRTIDRGEGGRFRVVTRRSWVEPGSPDDGAEEGREAVFDGARFASRRRFGPWIERETLQHEERRALGEAYDIAPGLLGAFGDYLIFREDPGADEVLAGLPVRWAALSLNPRVAPKALGAAELRALRDHETHWPAWVAATHKPTRVEGAIARVKGGGEVIAGRVELSGEARVEGRAARFRFRFSYTLESLPKGERFALPEELLSARRERPWRMIRDVLGEELAPAYRR